MSARCQVTGCNYPEAECDGACMHPPARRLLERDIEAHLVKRVKALGGEVRKVQWVGRASAPDRLVMLPGFHLALRDPASLAAKDPRAVAWLQEIQQRVAAAIPGSGSCVWVELKNPETIKTFPANGHERAQAREHERMRAMGQRVEVIGTIEQVEELLR
jgi:hypothetical protein